MSENNNKDRITYLKRELFILDMKDEWDSSDYSYSHQLKEELRKLEENSND